MNTKRIGAICLSILVYVIFLFELIMIARHPVKCSYEKNISEYDVETTQMPEDEYVCGFDRHEVNEEDLFRIAEISGWLVRQDTSGWKPVSADILLEGIEKSYKVHSYSVKRTDVYYTDQSDPDSKDLYIGHLSRFPATALEAGEYRIGFLMEESRTPVVYWTEETIVIP